MRAIEHRLRRLEAARPTSADPRAEALTARMKELDDDQLLELVELTHDPGCAACAAALAAWFAGAAEARVLFGGPGPPTLDVEDPPEPCPSCAAYVEGRRGAVFGPVPLGARTGATGRGHGDGCRPRRTPEPATPQSDWNSPVSS